MPSEAGPDWVEAEVIEVCRPDGPDHPLLRPHVVVLRERDGTRRLPMYTGSAQAIALACSLDAEEMPRPKAYQLAADLLGATASRLAEVRITALAEGVFHAVAVVEGPGGAVEVDARPSDAINLAVLAGVPIRAMPRSSTTRWSTATLSGRSTRRVWRTWRLRSGSAGPTSRPG